MMGDGNDFDTKNSKQGPGASSSGADRETDIISCRALSVESITEKKCTCGGFISTVSSSIIVGLETAFFNIGHFVGTYPILTIVTSLMLCCLTGLGMKTYSSDSPDDVWVPTGSRLLNEKKWVEAVFPDETRYVSYLIENKPNVLTPTVMKEMLEYYEESLKIKSNGKKFSKICLLIGTKCTVSSLLELWQYNSTIINNLTRDAIITTINQTEIIRPSGVKVETLLGGKLVRDAQGVIQSASATQMTWITTKKDEDASKEFEQIMIDMGLRGRPGIEKTYVYASRSLHDESNGALDSDIQLLTAGFIIVFAYVLLALGKFNLMEQKVYLSLAGMLCVGLSVLFAYGIGTALSVVYSPIQTIMPFLLLGIGVDNMFVIVESWKNLSPEDVKLDVPDKIALCFARAGVSITVTSITDVVAFGIGASTVIPALSSFCIYATIGIFGLFFSVSTIFVGVLAVDERRRKSRRDACIVCYRHSENYQPNKWSTGKSFLQIFFGRCFGPFISFRVVKVLIIFLTLGMTSLGLWRFSLMEEDFDVVNYIPSDSYAHDYSRTREDLFNRQGISTRIYCGEFNYFAYLHNLTDMESEMAKSKYIQDGTINAWFKTFSDYLNKSVSSESEYYRELYKYLNGDGIQYRSFIRWNSTDEPRHIRASYITAVHVREEDSIRSIKSMDGLRKIIDNAGLPTFNQDGLPKYKCFSYVPEYMFLETNKVLQVELYRNLILAAVAVLVVTIILVANLHTSLMVSVCVFCTVVDVGGVLELWGTTIDTASSVLLTLSVGLAVDYSVHIGHTFMTLEGTREERAVSTLEHIGPAVFSGGLSTFLAFVLLANSASFGFVLFFRVFVSVVTFGLFHGLCLLPVLLSIMGPPSYKELHERSKEKSLEQSSPSNGHLQTKMPPPDRSTETNPVSYEYPFSHIRNADEEETGADNTADKQNDHLSSDLCNDQNSNISQDSTSDVSKPTHVSVIYVNSSTSDRSSDKSNGNVHQPDSHVDRQLQAHKAHTTTML